MRGALNNLLAGIICFLLVAVIALMAARAFDIEERARVQRLQEMRADHEKG